MSGNLASTGSSSIALNSAVQVSEKQKGNPLLKHLRIVQFTFNRGIVPDYVIGSTCIIFVSLKYHLLHPKHADRRISEVGKDFRLRVLLVLVDDENCVRSLLELNKLCFVTNFSLILAWSNEEAARYIETFKSYENKSSSSIQEKVETEFIPRLSRSLTSVRSINKTDVVTLLEAFGSLGNICAADQQQLVLCPGIGEKKMKRLFNALHEPFSSQKKCRASGAITYSSQIQTDKANIMDSCSKI